jgi:Gram-negative bacterial TonB protein C-terminal
MAHPWLVASARRRSMMAGSASLALHIALVGLAVVLTGELVGDAPAQPSLTSIEVVDAPRRPGPPVPVQVAPPSPIAQPQAMAHSRRGPEPPRPAQTKPAAVKELLDDVTVSYDDPDNFKTSDASDEPAQADRAPLSSAIASGGHVSEDGLATLQMPAPASASLARPPKPRHDYHKLRMHSVKQFAGLTIKILLSVDEHGVVSDVRVVQGIESDLDRRTVALVRQFLFEPALDDVGTPVPGTSPWNILIVDEAKESIKANLERGFY